MSIIGFLKDTIRTGIFFFLIYLEPIRKAPWKINQNFMTTSMNEIKFGKKNLEKCFYG